MAPTYAIVATARFHDQIVGEARSRYPRPLRISSDGPIDLPIPLGADYLLQAKWASTTELMVVDGAGQAHRVQMNEPITIAAGPLTVVVEIVEEFRLRRMGYFVGLTPIMAWFAVIMIASVTAGKGEWVVENRCLIGDRVMGTQWLVANAPSCFKDQSEKAAADIMIAEYLARLLEEDYAGAEQGVIENKIEREESERAPINTQWLPAGAKGDEGQMGGAEEVAPEPVRTTDDPEEVIVAKKKSVAPPLALENTDAPAIPPSVEEQNGDLDGVAEVDEKKEREEQKDQPADDQEGWGIPDWYDENDRLDETSQIEWMTLAAERRVRINPNDPASLSLLAYYQYLGADYEKALDTYDRFIEGSPGDPAGYNNKALVYKRLEQWKKEEVLYRVSLSLQPDDTTAMNNLGVNLSHQGRFEEALEVMLQLEKLDPNDPYADLHRAKIYAEMGDNKQAFVYLDKALSGMKDLSTLHHIEFRQDIRVDPSFAALRKTRQFREILFSYYGAETPLSGD